jgi:RimJ/RimL family protein N-acetyltransferase
MQLDLKPLDGLVMRLEPLTPELKAPLRAAMASQVQDWDLMATNGGGEAFDAWWSSALGDMAKGHRIAYAIRRLADGVVVGTTSLMEISAGHRKLEIGSTFLHADARGGLINPDAKRALLAYVFDQGAVRVEIITDARNLRSQAAIAKLGAVREGVLRRHKITWTGHVRDTVVYAITDQDWPAVKAGLNARLSVGLVQT